MSGRIGYFASAMSICDPDRSGRYYLYRSSAESSSSSLGARHTLNSNYGYRNDQYRSLSSSGQNSLDLPVRPAYDESQRSRSTYEPRTAGSSCRGGYMSYGETIRSIKARNYKISGEYEKITALPIIGSGSTLDFPYDFPNSLYELTMKDARDIQDLCSNYDLDYGSNKKDNVVLLLRYLGATELAKSYGANHIYGELW